MPDLRQKRKAAAPVHDRRRKLRNQLPATPPNDGGKLPGDITRDISQDGVAFDPKKAQREGDRFKYAGMPNLR